MTRPFRTSAVLQRGLCIDVQLGFNGLLARPGSVTIGVSYRGLRPPRCSPSLLSPLYVAGLRRLRDLRAGVAAAISCQSRVVGIVYFCCHRIAVKFR